MRLRPFQPSDLSAITHLFYETVHSVTAKDYTQEQREAWAPASMFKNESSWFESLTRNDTFVVEDGARVVGFIDISAEGYLDRLFVHKDYQRQGVATQLLKAAEAKMEERGIDIITTEVSITAKAFFEHHGFKVVKDQVVYKNGVGLRSFKMEKHSS